MPSPKADDLSRTTDHGPSRDPAATPHTVAADPLPEREGMATRSFLTDPNATTGVSSSPAAAAAQFTSTERYRLGVEIARGGMGIVCRATDTVLGREVAVKLLQKNYGPTSEAARRFADEARITARLQHPAIPPVHDLGTLPDGRPFLAMKLIQGETLAALLAARPEPSAERGRFVAAVEQVCQALAYAHSHNVIHRDLKPANVMVGAFGEVQVMDWGLAKDLIVRVVTGEPHRSETPRTQVVESDLDQTAAQRTGSESTDDRTQAGQVMGTPAFMPPEQARGELGRVDRRSDVFALGGLLCVVLTGKPPYEGRGADVFRKATTGDLTDTLTRLDGCGADAELVALCKRCLSPEVADRPADAAEVAGLVAAYRAGVEQRLRAAERERAAAEAKAAEQRKRRRVQLLLAFVVLAAVVAAGGVWLRQAQQRETARTEVSAALVQSRNSMSAGNLSDAMAAARHAEGLLGATGNDPAARREVDDRVREIDFVTILERIRSPENTSQERIASRSRADGRYAQAFRDLDIDIDALEPEEAARRIEARPALKPYLVAALDDWVGPRRQARHDDGAAVRRLLEVARHVDSDPWRDRLRDAIGRGNMAEMAEMARDADVRTQTISALLTLAEQLMIGGQRKEAVALLRRARWEHPEDFWLSFNLGMWSGNDSDPGGIEEGTQSFAVAVALRPRNVDAWSGYSLMLEKQGRNEEAVIASRRAVDLEPNSCSAQMALAGALTCIGDKEGENQARRRAVELLREQVRDDPADHEAWVCLGVNLERMGERQKAVQANQEAARLAPRNAWARHNVGAILRKQGKPDEALPWLEDAVRLSPDSAYMLSTLGLARSDAGKGPGAEEALRKAIAIQPYYLPSYGSLAEVLRVRGDVAGRDAMLQRGLRACAAVLEKYPNSFRAEFLTGFYLSKAGDLAESVKHSRRAIELSPSNADAHANLAMVLHELGLLDEAVEASRQGARRAEPSELVFNNLAYDLIEKGEAPDEAYQAIQHALTLEPDSDLANLTLAEVLRAQGKFPESLEAFRRGHLLHSKKAVKKWDTAEWVKEAERLVELERGLPAVLSGERKLTTATENLEYGRLCGYKEQFAAATRFYQTAFTLDRAAAENLATGSRHQAARCALLAAQGRGKDAPSDEGERAQLRRQALEWLRADLALWAKRADDKSNSQRAAVRQSLNAMRTHDALIGVRDEKALAALPEGERRAWQEFWTEVAALLTRIDAKPAGT